MKMMKDYKSTGKNVEKKIKEKRALKWVKRLVK